jgi:hypothetical protein
LVIWNWQTILLSPGGRGRGEGVIGIWSLEFIWDLKTVIWNLKRSGNKKNDLFLTLMDQGIRHENRKVMGWAV